MTSIFYYYYTLPKTECKITTFFSHIQVFRQKKIINKKNISIFAANKRICNRYQWLTLSVSITKLNQKWMQLFSRFSQRLDLLAVHLLKNFKKIYRNILA